MTRRLIYVSNARLPSLKANSLQIMQNCEAFAGEGAQVTLWYPRRRRVDSVSAQGEPFAYYGVQPNFTLKSLPCLDLMPEFQGGGWGTRLAFYAQVISTALVMFWVALFTRADVFYSRDLYTLLLLSLIKRRDQLVYEAHGINRNRAGVWLQRTVLGRVGLAVPITPPLRDHLAQLQANHRHKARLLVAHDGFRRARFEGVPDQAGARVRAGWSGDVFVVGYVGRLQTMGMSKGVDEVIDALALVNQQHRVALALVGGPNDIAEQYRARWVSLGLAPELFLYAGQVAAVDVPLYLSAFDVCVLPLPWTPHFAYAASPIKLFEYMASGRALIASDLPSYADVLTDGQNALTFPPSDVPALADAIRRLYEDALLRAAIGQKAQSDALTRYTWDARARAILGCVP